MEKLLAFIGKNEFNSFLCVESKQRLHMSNHTGVREHCSEQTANSSRKGFYSGCYMKASSAASIFSAVRVDFQLQCGGLRWPAT